LSEGLSRIETQLGAALQDIKMLEAGLAVLTAYRSEMVDARVRDRLAVLETSFSSLREDIVENKQLLQQESKRIQQEMRDLFADMDETHASSVKRLEEFHLEQDRRTRRWTGYAIALAVGLMGLIPTIVDLVNHTPK
jgi:hypothetical protein